MSILDYIWPIKVLQKQHFYMCRLSHLDINNNNPSYMQTNTMTTIQYYIQHSLFQLSWQNLTCSRIKVDAAPWGVTSMLLSIQAVSYLHTNGLLPDSPGWRSDLALCFSHKIFLQYTSIDGTGLIQISKHNADVFICEYALGTANMYCRCQSRQACTTDEMRMWLWLCAHSESKMLKLKNLPDVL